VTVGASGLPALQRDLADLAARVRDTDAPDSAAAGIVASRVRARAPRRTGYLANSVTASGPRVEVMAPYAPYVEARHPFAAPAAAEAEISQPYEQHIEQALPDTLRARY
jgi:hypothetical protein